MRRLLVGAVMSFLVASGLARAADVAADKAVYDSGCTACHGSGVAGAPKLGDAAAWQPRIAAGVAAMVANVRAGKGAMPPMGGMAALTEVQLVGVVNYMIGRSGAALTPAAKAVVPAAALPASVATRAVAAAAALPASVPTRAVAAAAVVALAPPSGVNAFNRLLRPSLFNRPPTEDLIHDPSNDGTLALQPPLTAFSGMPRSHAGNRVDWVKSLAEGKIAPRADRIDANAKAAVMDLNIVREVKGSMPDVVYPHKQHTEWLDCSNCHPAIFKPQKGANQISMAGILLGQACGVCHGKVAFPVSECRLCHSKAKPAATAAAVAVPANEAAPK